MPRSLPPAVVAGVASIFLLACDGDAPSRSSPGPGPGDAGPVDAGSAEVAVPAEAGPLPCPIRAPDRCGPSCTTLASSASNCGACGHRCPSRSLCVSGGCECADPAATVCGDACIDPGHDPANCGGCGHACGATCRAGACTAVRALSLGGQHSVALLDDGTAAVWGYDGFGQLADGANQKRSVPFLLPDPTTLVVASAGRTHTCFATALGVSCAGDNAFGQLGDSLDPSSSVPLAIPGLPGVTALAAGGRHTCALGADGAVSCWGWNANGQVGDGTLGALRPAPVKVPGISGAAEITAGASHTCARLAAGAVRCWGGDRDGQLGDGGSSSRPSPVEVAGLGAATSIAAGARHTCAVIDDGTVRCWGAPLGQSPDAGPAPAPGDAGRADGGSRPTTLVVVSGLAGATRVAAGDGHACALLTDGTVRCWGAGEKGQLGDGASRSSPAPVAASGVAAAVEIAAGGDHTCARLADGSALCWGAGAAGEIGDGATAGRASPVPVLWQ